MKDAHISKASRREVTGTAAVPLPWSPSSPSVFHETAIYHVLVWIRSEAVILCASPDMNTYRYEPTYPPLIPCGESPLKEAHTVHATWEGADSGGGDHKDSDSIADWPYPSGEPPPRDNSLVRIIQRIDVIRPMARPAGGDRPSSGLPLCQTRDNYEAEDGEQKLVNNLLRHL